MLFLGLEKSKKLYFKEAGLKLHGVAHTCNHSTRWVEEAGGPEAQGRSWIGRECEASLGYMRPALKNSERTKEVRHNGPGLWRSGSS